MPPNGLFITFEGIEGSGKSTQIEKLARHFRGQKRAVVTTKEPGGTPMGLQLRKMILMPETPFRSQLTEILLFYADRLEHVEGIVKPALSEGKIVLCDRYIDSTMAYQAGGRKIPLRIIENLNSLVDLVPDLTILFDLEAREGLRRAKNRGEALDRFEKEKIDFHNRVRDGYLAQAKKYAKRIKTVSVANLSPDEVFAETLRIISAKI